MLCMLAMKGASQCTYEFWAMPEVVDELRRKFVQEMSQHCACVVIW